MTVSGQYGTNVDLTEKLCQGQPMVIIYINFVDFESSMPHFKFQGNWKCDSKGESYEGFYNIWAMWLSWSCDLDYLFKLLFSLLNAASHEMWLFRPRVL